MTTLIKILLVALSVLFLTLQSLDYPYYAYGVKAFLLFGLFILYINVVKKKRFWFSMFLSFFALSELFNFLSFDEAIMYNNVDLLFFLINGLYILSFSFLIAHIVRRMNFKEVISKYKIHILVLLVMNVFFVLSVTETTAKHAEFSEYILLFIYYSTIMILLSIAFINFLHWDDQKSMNFLVGTLFLVFSEVAQITYYTVAEIKYLSIIWSVLLILSFLFFYRQAIMGRGSKLVDYQEVDYGEMSSEQSLT